MSISSQVARTGPFLITGSPQTIPVGFPFQQGSDLLVLDIGTVATPKAGVTLTLGSDYTVTGGGYNGSTQMQVGSIVVVAGGVNGVLTNDQIMILRNVPINQTSSLAPTEPLTVQVIEKALDKQATISQELQEEFTRSLHFPAGEKLDGTMPLASRINRYLAFDANGVQIFLAGTASTPDSSVSFVTATGGTTAQTLANRFGWQLTVKDFGAVGNGVADDTAAIQAAITVSAGRPLHVPAGSYRITSTLTYNTNVSRTAGLKIFGDGMAETIFVNEVVSGPCIKADANGSSSFFQLGGFLRDFSIASTGLFAASIGVTIKACWFMEINRIRITGHTSHGFYIPTSLGDGDACAHLQIHDNEFTGNGGYGLVVDVTGSGFGVSTSIIENNLVQANAAGGIKLTGLLVRILNNSIAQNRGEGGLYVFQGPTGSRFIDVEGNEFDSNSPQHYRLENCLGGNVGGNKLTFQDDGSGYGYRPTLGLVLGSTAAIRSIRVSGSVVNSNPTNPSSATTLFQVGSFATDTFIEKTCYVAFSGGNATRITDAGVNTGFEDDGATCLKTNKPALVNVGASPVVPNLLNGFYQRLKITIAAVTVNAPTPATPPDGREMILSIVNGSGGGITITFSADYVVTGYTDPAAGLRKTARFIYDATSGVWIQVGNWS